VHEGKKFRHRKTRPKRSGRRKGKAEERKPLLTRSYVPGAGSTNWGPAEARERREINDGGNQGMTPGRSVKRLASETVGPLEKRGRKDTIVQQKVLEEGGVYVSTIISVAAVSSLLVLEALCV